MHSGIIAALEAAGANSDILDDDGNSAQDFDLRSAHGERDVHGNLGDLEGATDRTGPLKTPDAVQSPLRDREEL